MAKKELSIIVKAVDQATAPIRSITSNLLGSVKSVHQTAISLLSKVAAAAKTAAMATLGVLGVGGFAAWKAAGALIDAAETLEQIDNASTRLGIAVEDLSALRYVASQADVDFESLSSMIAKAQQNLSAFVYDGSGPAADAVKKLGLNVRDANGQVRPMRDLLPEIVEQMQAITDPALRMDITRSIFGKNSEEIIQVMSLGADGIRQLVEQGQRLGVVFTKEQTARANAFTDAIDRVGQAWLGLKVQVLDRVAPFLERLLDRAAGLMAAVPQIVSRLSRVMDDTAEGADIRDSLASFVLWTWQLIKDVVLGGLSTFIDNTFDDLSARLSVFGDTIQATFYRVIEKTFGKQMLSQKSREFLDAIDTSTFEERFAKAREAVNPIDNGTRWKQWSMNVATSAEYAWNWLDRAGQITQALDAHAVSAIQTVDRLLSGGGRQSAPTDLELMFRGAQNGLEEFMRKARDVQSWADDFTTSSLTSLSSALGSAFVDSIKDIKNWATITRDALAGVADAVAKTAAQMAAARLITGVIGAFGGAAGAGAGAAAGAAAGGSTEYSQAYAALANVNAGGLITEHGVRRFDAGGLVPGPNLNRDIVPAVLTPGERVIRRAVSQRYPGQLDALNRGASPETAFGTRNAAPVSLSVHTTVNVNAPTAAPIDQRSLERSVMSAVMSAIDRSPALREKLRAAIA